MKLTREDIINHFYSQMKDNKFVNAIWLEGSDGTKTTDEYSDIDLWLDVEDGREDEIMELSKNIFSYLGTLDHEIIMPQGSSL